MFRTSLLTLSFISLLSASACRTNDQTSAIAGGGVNNGPGPVGDIVVCKGATDDSTADFTIRHTAVVTFKQGLLQLGDQVVNMKCDQAQANGDAAPDRAGVLWTCAEIRESGGTLEGLYRATVYRQGLSAIKLVDITIGQMFPLKPQKIATLGCH